MSSVEYSVVLPCEVAGTLEQHLLQHTRQGRRQEDLCFGLWTPSTGSTRTTAVLQEVILPQDGERRLHGNASFFPEYLDRVADLALAKRAGIAFSAQPSHAGMAAHERHGRDERATHGAVYTGNDRSAPGGADHGDRWRSECPFLGSHRKAGSSNGNGAGPCASSATPSM